MQNKQHLKQDLEEAGAPAKTAKIITDRAERGDAPIPAPTHLEDKRATARQEHPHFTNRADSKSQ